MDPRHSRPEPQLRLWGDEDDALIDDGWVRPPARRRRSRRLWGLPDDVPVARYQQSPGRVVTVETGDYL